jgi:hypothetical protein
MLLIGISLVLCAGCDLDDPSEPGGFPSDEPAIVSSEALVPAGGAVDFDAEAGGETIAVSQWRILGDVDAGTISHDGTYSAPDRVSGQFSVTIEATVPILHEDPTFATVTVIPPSPPER